MRKIVAVLFAAPLMIGAAPDPKAARGVHERAIVLDTHFDTPANLGRAWWSIMDRHDVAVTGDQALQTH